MGDKQQDSSGQSEARPVEIEDAKLETVAGGQRRRGGEDDDRDLEDLDIQR